MADGHLTREPNETVYSGVLSLRNLSFAMFLAELNELQLWGVMLEMHTSKHSQKRSSRLWLAQNLKSDKDMFLLCTKNSYGTRSGGACWHDKLFGILQQMDFKTSKGDPDICMRFSKDGTHYEYIAVYVDDLAICMKDPQAFCDTLKEKYKLKVKGIGPLSYHLGC